MNLALVMSNLRAKLLVLPISTMLFVFLVSGFIIAHQVQETLRENEDAQLYLTSRVLNDLYDNVLRDSNAHMKNLVMQSELNEAYFTANFEENTKPLREFFAAVLEATTVDHVFVVRASDGQKQMLLDSPASFGPELAALYPFIDPVLTHPSITNPQQQLDQVIRSFMWNDGGQHQLISIGPLLDVEDIVGAVILLRPVDHGFVVRLKNTLNSRYFKGRTQAEVSLAWKRRVTVSTLPNLDLPTELGQASLAFDVKVGATPFRNLFAPLDAEKRFLLGLSIDTTANTAARTAINISMGAVILISLGLVVFIILINVNRVVGRLQAAHDELNKAQNQLVESEKMAALGGLVAGVAHEINTPVGVSVTAATTLKTRTNKFLQIYRAGAMKRADLNTFLKHALQSTELIFNNLQRAGDLIKSFKQIAVDRTSDEDRTFNVKEYFNEILLSLRPTTKKTNHDFIIRCDDDLTYSSSPGIISQIITNLLMNSMVHAFDDQDQGEIVLAAFIRDDRFVIKFSDNGRGIAAENLDKIFEPFFTTKRGMGGSGLGLHIIYNLITQKLGGEISCTSRINEGTEFIIRLPLQGGAQK